MRAGKPIEGRDVLSPAWLRERAAAVGPMPPGDVAFVPIAAPLCSLIADALEIADESAWCLIESESHAVDMDGWEWRDSANREPIADAALEQSLRYLALRGLLVRHAENPHLVRVAEPDA